MNRIVVILLLFLSSCSALKKIDTYDDDIYLDPKNDRSAFYPKPPEPQATEALTSGAKKANAANDNNPYYKDRDFKYDDYYDNEYAARLKRFKNPMNGVGYYDTYYTNSYFYNQNPYQYGVSIYNGYNWMGSSYNNYSYVPNYNWGGMYGYGTCSSYDPYMYNNVYSPYNINNNWYYSNSPFGYGGYGAGNSYGYGYGNPYGYGNNYSPYSNYNPGYYNSYDHASSTYYGPRVSHSGSNSPHAIIAEPDKMTIIGKGKDAVDDSYGPTSTERFHQVVPQKEVKQQTVVNSAESGNVYTNSTEHYSNQAKPVKNENAAPANAYNGNPKGNTATEMPSGSVKYNTENTSNPSSAGNDPRPMNPNGSERPVKEAAYNATPAETKPVPSANYNNGNNKGNTSPVPGSEKPVKNWNHSNNDNPGFVNPQPQQPASNPAPVNHSGNSGGAYRPR